VYIFSLIAGGCGATSVDKGDSGQKLLPLYSSQSSLTTPFTFKIYSSSKKKDEDKSVKAAMTTTMMTMTGARGTTLVYTRVFRLYSLYT